MRFEDRPCVESEAARAVAVNVAAVFADVATQLLALFRREASLAAFRLVVLLLAALQLLAPELALALDLLATKLALLLVSLETALPVAGLGLGGQAGSQGKQDACKCSQAFHGFIPALSGVRAAGAPQKRRSASCLSW